MLLIKKKRKKEHFSKKINVSTEPLPVFFTKQFVSKKGYEPSYCELDKYIQEELQYMR